MPGLQVFRSRIERKRCRRRFDEYAARDEEAQYPPQRVGIHGQYRGERLRAARAECELICNAKFRRNIERLRVDGAADQLTQVRFGLRVKLSQQRVPSRIGRGHTHSRSAMLE